MKRPSSFRLSAANGFDHGLSYLETSKLSMSIEKYCGLSLSPDPLLNLNSQFSYFLCV